MKLFSVVFKMGQDDVYSSPRKAHQSAEVDICYPMSRLKFRLGSIQEQLRELSLFPSEVGLDFCVLGGAVYAADTRIKRLAHAQDGWSREILVSVPVSDVDRWNEHKQHIESMLRFLTGDHWSLEFRLRPHKYMELVKQDKPVLPIQQFSSINLFSGGVDSLVGAIDEFEKGNTPLLISHYGEGKSSVAQDNCFNGLKEKFQRSHVKRIGSSVSFEKKHFPWKENEEPTTRGRSFLFFALAAAAASAMPVATPIIVPENGLISLNIPLEPLRLGALSTRTTHPYYMKMWSELVESMGVASRLYNPYQLKTKGEMLKECGDEELLKTLLPVSVSCSNPTGSRFSQDSHNHCGHCMPCIIRRSAIAKAFSDDITGYRLTDAELRQRELNSRKAEGQNYRAFLYALHKLASNPEAAHVLIHKSGPLDGSYDELSGYVDLYRRGMWEVKEFVTGVRTRPFK